MNHFIKQQGKKILIAILAAALAGSLAACSRGNSTIQEIPPAAPEPEIASPEPEAPERPEFLISSVTGTITLIEPFYENDGVTVREGWFFVYLTDGNGGEHSFSITESTYFATGSEMAEGDTITGFYDGNAPMLMIYPPRYNVEVVAINLPEAISLKVDRFDENFVSFDNMLKLNVDGGVEIILQDGTPFEGDLTNRKLVVFYNISTRSIPAQTTPKKIVVLFESAEAPIYRFGEQEYVPGIAGDTAGQGDRLILVPGDTSGPEGN